MNANKSLGNWGENKASSFLKDQGFTILQKNLSYPFGEVDIIASKKNILYFVEVKTRTCDKYGSGAELITQRKIERIKKVAETYIHEHSLDTEVRVALISIYKSGEQVSIDWLPVK